MTLHPRARQSFDERAAALLARCSLAAVSTHESADEPAEHESWSSPPVSATIRSSDLAEHAVRTIGKDDYGEEVRLERIGDQGRLTFAGAHFLDLQRLVESMQAARPLRDTVSRETLRDLIADWVWERLVRSSQESMCDHVLPRVNNRIDTYTIVIPIHELFVEQEFDVGRVRIVRLSEARLADWISEPQADPATRDVWAQVVGRAAATLTLRAERRRAYEVAFDEAEVALAALRSYSEGVLVPNRRSHCTVLGQENAHKRIHFVVKQGRMVGLEQAFHPLGGTSWQIDAATLNWMLREQGLAVLSDLIRSTKRTEFQEEVLRSIVQYSRSALAERTEEKLLYVLAAMESVLLRSNSEPIQANLGPRVAYLTADSLPDRKEVVRIVRRAYDLRSRWVHHLGTVDEMKEAREFLLVAWDFFRALTAYSTRFRTKAEFLGALEDRRLSGP